MMMDNDVWHDDLACPKCGADEVYSQSCWKGCDDGYFDGYEDDPLWYDPGDMYICDECHGRGILRWCHKCGADLTLHRWPEDAPA